MKTVTNIQIYRIADEHGSGFLQEEVCRDCIQVTYDKGKLFEFDEHLCKYVYGKDEATYYAEGGENDGSDSEIVCSLCFESFITEKDRLTEKL